MQAAAYPKDQEAHMSEGDRRPHNASIVKAEGEGALFKVGDLVATASRTETT
jgi:hypothetical protein